MMKMLNVLLLIANQVFDLIMMQCFYFYPIFYVSNNNIIIVNGTFNLYGFILLVYAILSANSIDGNLIYEELLAVISNDIDDSITNNTNIPESSEDILGGRQIALEYQNTNSSEQQNETTTRVMYVKTAFTLLDFLFKWSREQKASKNTICEPVMSKIFFLYIY